MLTQEDADLLRAAFRQAIKEASPDIAEATTRVIQQQFEQSIGRGLIGWLKRIAISALLAFAGYHYIKTGGG